MTEEDRDIRLGNTKLSFGKHLDSLKKMDDETKSKEADAIAENDKTRQAEQPLLPSQLGTSSACSAGPL
jgi:hypothetical protein